VPATTTMAPYSLQSQYEGNEGLRKEGPLSNRRYARGKEKHEHPLTINPPTGTWLGKAEEKKKKRKKERGGTDLFSLTLYLCQEKKS